MITEFSLPLKPLTVNQAWRGGRRFNTAKYRKFAQDVSLLIPGGTKRWTGFVEVKFIFYLENWKRTDVDNLIKPLLDVLVAKGIIENDNLVMKITAEKKCGENMIWVEIGDAT